VEFTVKDQADTRNRIKDVALELFTEQGYEATSLREIAERLHVTKAALYYHFKTKEDIVASLIEDRTAHLDELIAWAQDQSPGPDLRREFIRRYAAELYRDRHYAIMRFFERNQAALGDIPSGVKMRERMFAVLKLLYAPDEPLTRRLRCSLAILALHAAWFMLRDPDVTDEQRQAAALEVALDLIE
jgi:AcrR family transcriptional regulator